MASGGTTAMRGLAWRLQCTLTSAAGRGARPSLPLTFGLAEQPAFPLSLTARSGHRARGLRTTTASLAARKSSVEGSSAGSAVHDLSEFTPDLVRNFAIVAHIDHGKSTLADRLLEITGTIDKTGDNKQVLDTLQVERERGITVRSQSATMIYEHEGKKYLVNLIDTPGHVDFANSVSRALAACQGVLLLVDAVNGVQAQTVANFFLAFEQDLKVLFGVNKVDLQHADVERTWGQMQKMFDCERGELIEMSAKSGLGVGSVLPAVIRDVPAPAGERDGPLKCLLFDSWHDPFRGVICLMELLSGTLRPGDAVKSAHTGNRYEVTDLGILRPQAQAARALYAGHVGYVVMNMKSCGEAQIGDTFFAPDRPVEPLPGFKPTKAVVFAGIYPVDPDQHDALAGALDKIVLTDPSVTMTTESSPALGQGWRFGFLGMLHMDVFQTRLEQEYGQSVMVTAPSVPMKVVWKDHARRPDLREEFIENPHYWPDTLELQKDVAGIYEPMVVGTLVFPNEHMGAVLALGNEARGTLLSTDFLDELRTILKFRFPLCEIATEFFNDLKSATSGYASFDYEEDGYQASNIQKVSVLVNKFEVDPLAVLVHESRVRATGRNLCQRLREQLKRGLFEIAIQATVGNKIIARETLRAFRKDVTAKCYGGDMSRKRKLLEKQKEGRSRMQRFGNVDVPREAFMRVIRKN